MTDTPDPWWTRGIAHHRRGELAEAWACYRQIPASSPHHPAALCNQGAIAAQTGHPEEAAALLRRSLTFQPRNTDTLINLGNVLADLGRPDEAQASFRQALALEPDNVDAINNLGTLLRDRGALAEARECFHRVLALEPRHVEALNNLGNVLCALGQLAEAAECYRQALLIRPDMVEALSNLGAALYAMGQTEAAETHCRQALAIMPNHVGALANLGAVLNGLGRIDEAAACCRQALASHPHHVEALTTLGALLNGLGQPDEATTLLQRALALRENENPRDPRSTEIRRNLFACQLYRPELTAAELFRLCRDHAEASPPRLAPTFPDRQFEADKRLRVGYLSSDFRAHPVADNLLPLFTHHDRHHFEIFVYAIGFRHDAMTRHLQSLANHWRTLGGLEDEAIADTLRKDRLDLLVFLAGHFDGNRPELCRHRLAPVQISFHDATSSGFPEMDWWLTDAFLHPYQTIPEQFTEQLYRLPCFYQYERPASPTPESWDPPADRNGFITFGSFNNPAKISDTVLKLWGRLLNAVPGSRIQIQYLNLFSNPGLRHRYLDRFARQGLPPERILLPGERESSERHWARLRSVDIALDPFPFNGATATFRALWMGVPVISLQGDRFLGRVGASFLHHLQLPELIARTPDDYVAKAAALAADRERLRTCHRTLRQKNGPVAPLSGRGLRRIGDVRLSGDVAKAVPATPCGKTAADS